MVNINVKKFSRSKITTEESIPQPSPVIEESSNNDFLADLHKDNYNKSIEEKEQEETNKKEFIKLEKEREKEQKQREKENEKLIKELEKKNKTIKKKVIDNDNESIYSDEGTPVLGKNRNILLKKIKQYKNLFPEELKKFKIKPNPSEKELQEYLSEMEVLVELNSVDDFLTDSIIQSVKVIENTTAHTENYNITGLSEILKANPQFHSLCKQLYIKYNTFSSVPPEYQLVFIVATSAYVVRNKNKEKNKIELYINQKIEVNETKL